MTNSATTWPTSSAPTTSPNGSRPSMASHHTSSSARHGQKTRTIHSRSNPENAETRHLIQKCRRSQFPEPRRGILGAKRSRRVGLVRGQELAATGRCVQASVGVDDRRPATRSLSRNMFSATFPVSRTRIVRWVTRFPRQPLDSRRFFARHRQAQGGSQRHGRCLRAVPALESSAFRGPRVMNGGPGHSKSLRPRRYVRRPNRVRRIDRCCRRSTCRRRVPTPIGTA